MIRTHFRPIAVLLQAVLAVGAVAAEVSWKVGDEFRQELQSSDSIDWTNRQIRDGLASLSTSQGVACWLDRRIDPSRELNLSLEGPLLTILQQLAGQVRATVGYAGPVVYIGPPETAAKLWTIAELRSEEVERLPPEMRSKWTQRRRVQWEMLATPRELLAAIAEEIGWTFEELDAIPHDLWPAADLPPLTTAERLTLVLAGFDRTFSIDPDQRIIRLTTLPDQPQLQRQYSPTGDAARAFAELKRKLPAVNMERAGSKLVVIGSAEEHDSIRRLLRGERVRGPANPMVEVRYRLEVKNQPLGAILRKIESNAKLQMFLDEFANDQLRTLVSLKVENVTLEQLLSAALQGTGLTFQLEGNQLRISKAK